MMVVVSTFERWRYFRLISNLIVSGMNSINNVVIGIAVAMDNMVWVHTLLGDFINKGRIAAAINRDRGKYHERKSSLYEARRRQKEQPANKAMTILPILNPISPLG
jgi:hypothetical protein